MVWAAEWCRICRGWRLAGVQVDVLSKVFWQGHPVVMRFLCPLHLRCERGGATLSVAGAPPGLIGEPHRRQRLHFLRYRAARDQVRQKPCAAIGQGDAVCAMGQVQPDL